MTDAAPLQPPAPQSAFALDAPAPVQAVSSTQAPAMAPRIDESALPGLESYDEMMTALINSTMAV